MERSFLEKHFPLLLLLVIAINATCFFTPILDGDSVLYASIAKRMAQSNEWLSLYSDGKDWLDKPHFPFWAAAFSFKIFGFSSFAYKLPGFLFCGLSMYYIYRTGILLYSHKVAMAAVLLFGVALHQVLANFDLRAESFLTAFIIASAYFIIRADAEKKWKWYAGLAVAAAGAIMTKGIFAGITIGGGYFLYLAFSKKLSSLFTFKWAVCLLLIFLFITPELYALYSQFDRHPEKIVFGQTHVSGLRFFFWDSQFGRFFNSGPIKGNGDLSFFLHTTLWAFLPWSFFLVAALIQMIRRRAAVSKRIIIGGSAFVTFLLFSLSRFQLPHYIVIIFPHLSLITAAYILSVEKPKALSRWGLSMTALVVLVCIAVTALAFYSKIGNSLWALLPVWIIGLCAVVFFKRNENNFLIVRGIFFSAALIWFMDLFFYPKLMQYQNGIPAAAYVNSNYPTVTPGMYGYESRTFELYSKMPPLYFPVDSSKKMNTPFPALVFIPDNYFPQLINEGYTFTVLKTFEEYRITKLTGAFLDPHRRKDVVSKSSLIQINKAP